MKKKTFRFGPYVVRVSQKEWSVPPWDVGVKRPTYRVEVSYTREDSGESFLTEAWGSIADGERGEDERFREMAIMVLDELCSAYVDPDEFVGVATDGVRVTAKQLRQLADVLEYAQKLGSEELIDIVNEIRN